MPKKHLHARLSDEAIATLQKYTLDHKLETTTEALEQILSGVQNSFLSPSDASGASDPFIDQPACNQRRTIDMEVTKNKVTAIEKVTCCIIPATLSRGPKTVEIPSALVCEVCQSIRRNFPAQTLQTSPQPAEVSIPMTAPTESLARNQDPSNSTRKNAGQVWCPDGGFWKYPIMCDKCREQTYPQWYTCHTEKLRQKGELQRASTANPPS